ncbi:hypothetical protein SAMN04487786_3158 [Paenisporosarcina quisquiliarum]|jgi:hypothetical protein|uniref:hypothetical protein n=1 Tax=Psychrobacillus TaxID=1221880 RepID=UPI0008B87A36|nr:hypothetical protein [Psychrobacillus psychrodurans]MCK1997160.1 hypothetical protein [Psychrobacillus psychrodurans]MCZ8541149.1 hypothetical protein [Psychrobacillus psychrodurans]SEN06082.1 hypothetical protein SAMN04487786_3158 [Paenisporosarcina quisquiliarum]SFM87090.1 hypothetical protein SAMN05421832_10848 [Psychrobacillus psychrodurans]
MKRNWIFGLLIAAVSISALVFIIKGNINMAVLFMTAIFALSNGFRAISFKEKGFVKEAKWMKGMSILFIVLFFVVLFLLFF